MDMISTTQWQSAGSPGYLTVDLAALRRNYRRIAQTVAPARTAAVVKANAYGLGAQPVSQALFEEGCRDFFVAQYREALELVAFLSRDAKIYVLNGLQPGTEADCAAKGIIPVLNSLEQIARWRSIASLSGQRLAVVLQFDTGMSRLGMAVEEAEALAANSNLLAHLDVRYIMSHLACADEAENAQNDLQARAMARLADVFPGIPVCFGNSGGSFLGEKFRGALVRPGIALYGGQPTDILAKPMEPVVRIEGSIIQTRLIAPGTAVGYSATYVAESERRLATVALGYADGILRALSSRGAFFHNGVRLPIVGRVSMDSTIIDMTELPENALTLGSRVEFIGSSQSLEEVAEQAGTISWEVLTSIGHRYHRQYI